MHQTNGTFDVAIIGSGIAGLALARAEALRGNRVAVFERSISPLGASARNFGMVLPVGQGPETLEIALRGREIWLETAVEAKLWHRPSGLMHLAYHADEMAVLEEFVDSRKGTGYEVSLLTAEQVLARAPGTLEAGLLGGMFSGTEINIDAREAMALLPAFLGKKHGIAFFFNTTVAHIENGLIASGMSRWRAERIWVCSGVDFETLFPKSFAHSGLQKCKLQMWRTVPQPGSWPLGPMRCAGLTLVRYGSFAHCPSLGALRERLTQDWPEQTRWGIHGLVSQDRHGALVLGDSHEYGNDVSPFDNETINGHIQTYLDTFLQAPASAVAGRWHGVYPKGKHHWLLTEPTAGVKILSGLGGAGMTLAWGLAERLAEAY